jgi:hypothetical protein
MNRTLSIKIITLTALVTAAVATAGLAASAQASNGSGSCGTRALKTPFSSFGDSGQYFFAPNGGFESGTSSWTVGGGASVVSGNETSNLNAKSDSKSLSLPTGAWAKTAAFCTNPNDQTIRLMVKGSTGQLKVDAYILSGTNIRTWSTQVSASKSTGWVPSQVIQFALGNQYLGATTIQLTFTAIGAKWQIDDLYVDPFKGY